MIDRYSERYQIPISKRVGGCKVGTSEEVLLAKPNTYMNLSGGPVASLMAKFEIPPEALIVIQDDLDMEFGRIRIRKNGRDGGHKGVRSVIDALRTREFYRLKIGIGRDSFLAAEDYVLTPFPHESMEELAEIIDLAVEALHTFMFEGKEKAMSMYNRA